MTTEKITIRVTTAPGTNASSIGETYGSHDGVAWRNSVDRCDSSGHGRVFLDCDDEDTADYIEEQMKADADVVSYDHI